MTQAELGERILKLRERLGLSQLEFGLRCGLDSGHVSKIEKGTRSPQLGTLLNIANGLDISLSELLATEEPRISIYDEPINKVISYMLSMSPGERLALLGIAKIVHKKK